MPVTIDSIRHAAELLEDRVLRTPTIRAPSLSELTGSFKPRGAYVKLASLTERQRRAGVVAASAGNHALAP